MKPQLRPLLFALAMLSTTQPLLAGDLTAQEVHQLTNSKDPVNHDYVFVDVRSAREYKAGHVPGALHTPLRSINQHLAELAPHKDKTLVVYCEVGGRANFARAFLEQQGFKTVEMTGHMRAWRQRSQ